MEILSVVAGLGLLCLVAVDVFATVLHHWGGAGPLSGRLVHALWKLTVILVRPFEPASRRRVLGGIGPLMIPLIIALWAGVTILGFALLYFPWIQPHFVPDSGVPAPTGFRDALHFSGVSFFTIGYGDVVPVRSWMRALGVIEGGAGFAFVTLAISYFTSLYSGYAQQKVTAESVFFQAAESADAARIIRRHVAGGDTHTLATEVGRLRDRLAAIRTDYATYPILNYFIASRADQSLVRLLFVTQELITLLDTVLDAARSPTLAGLGERSGLLYAARSIQEGIAETLLPADRRAALRAQSPTADDQARWRARFAQVTTYLEERGVTVVRDAEAEGEYCRRRASWEPSLRACAIALGDEWEAVSDGL